MINILRAYLTALILAVLAAGAAIEMWSNLHPVLVALIADSVGTLVIFFFSRYHNNSSIYDPYWSVVPPLLALYWMLLVPLDELHPRVFVAFLLICIWSVRLTWNWKLRETGIISEDWRYHDIKEKTGRFFPIADLITIHYLPTILVFGGCLPFYFITTAGGAWTLFDLVAIIVIAGAIFLETIADKQLRRFLKTRAQGEILNHGVWTYSRHPNYCGEILFWWGLFIFAFAAAAHGALWTSIGAIAINLLFVFVSVPLMNARGRKHRPGYDEHIKRVRMLIPLPKLSRR